MEKLLHWSIANAQGDKDAIARAGQPDPRLLQQLFGGAGPDDATLMKESLQVIANEEAELEHKMIAMDNFELLIENIDNANNIENMKMWEPIIGILEHEEADMRAAALSIVGTAVQNNVSAQDNFIKYDAGLEKLIALASERNHQHFNVRVKALYALSNLIRNNETNAKKFYEAKGLDIVAPILSEKSSTPKLKMRTIALLAAFLTSVKIDSKLIDQLREENIIETTIICLKNETDLNLIDRILNFLSQLISAKITFSESELSKLNEGFTIITEYKDRLNEDDYLTVKHVLN
ncbi:hypothetical protein TPHA_0M01530 [Tetrapisispora phaffii CBS 4417]|uniref:Hsp70 nucleotide exchange factor FES1 n=1 Tax=Tetrapisispora phaffii (strain ATCC 24235 / CBS 4417 / NBRC 1672 / NRRL Y-8282 / UCD 70-5) TaxID=1071381 RepID=G8C0L3_TETPH|nr:hypothetical protein TPHA_0M01530 [Tetrapisispora phaffii CBS 4417]CCE65728.1 hypothetical protein TPHA_0M01530 [Tetrapisispora phaffii CBS 4417]